MYTPFSVGSCVPIPYSWVVNQEAQPSTQKPSVEARERERERKRQAEYRGEELPSRQFALLRLRRKGRKKEEERKKQKGWMKE